MSIPALFVSLALSVALAEDPSRWEPVLDKVEDAVVVLRVDGTRSFDTETASATVATGFVVDKKRGIILTNRHVVQPGPVVAEAVFKSNEEVAVQPLYRDPVHDFGFYHFDPADVRFHEVSELQLRPDQARVGLEVRVVGNDAGEKMSFLSGTLSRLDRDAPDYGLGNFNDFNTFYYLASAGTSGGSSGSPVVNLDGNVVALNAGSRRSAASSYFLPLGRVARALEYVQRGEAVPRGTLQAVFRYTGYDEVGRLGLRDETAAEVRAAFRDGTGMLVVGETVPGGPAWGVLEPGDVLVRVNGELLSSFEALETVLDGSVGRPVRLEVQRGGETLQVSPVVDDLHAITPSVYVEAGGGVFHPLSYQQARNHVVPVAGVYVASAGYMLAAAGVPRGAVITAIGSDPVPDIESFERVLASWPDGARVPVRWFDLSDPGRQRVSVVPVDRKWFPMNRCQRDDGTGLWPCVASPEPSRSVEQRVATASYVPTADRAAQALAPSLVMVEVDIPFRIEGVYGASFRGTGLVVDAEKGLVVADRDTVPIALGDVTLTFAGSVQIPARVRYLHPEHNIAVLSYDPALLGDTRVRAAVLEPEPLEVGEPVWHVAYTSNMQVVSRATRIERIQPLYVPLPRPPFFRDTNVEVVDPADYTSSMGGVLADKKGRVRALWASFANLDGNDPAADFWGLPIEVVADVVEPLRRGEDPAWRTLAVEFDPLPLSEARHRGLSDEWAARLEAHDPTGRSMLAVTRLPAEAPSAQVLREGDLVLAVAGEPVTRFREVELASQAPQIALTLLRDGQELQVVVDTWPLDGLGTSRVLIWAGAALHEPHLAAIVQRGIEKKGVYVAWYWFGSPADRYGLRPTRRIVAVDGKEVDDLDQFLDAVEGRADRDAVRLKTLSLDGKVDVITLKLDQTYWPARDYRLGGDGWTRTDY